MRRVLRILALIAAAALILYGMLQSDDKRWLLCLWGAAPLLMFAFWPAQDGLVQGVRRGVLNLGVVFGVGLILLSVQLLRLQVVRADSVYHRTVTDEQGRVTSNVRLVRQAMQVLRGDIVDRHGLTLASSAEVAGGFALRTYPVASQYNLAAFSNLLGFVSTRFGLAGIEESYNSYLTGERGSAWERIKDDIFHRQQRGNHLHLTIDARLQAAVYDLLGGRPGSVVVLDPSTGAILAMASYPGFDPQALTFNPGAEDWDAENQRMSAYWKDLIADERKPLLNRPAQGLYPPGSTFKTVTAVAALKYPDVARPNQIDCPNERPTEPGAPPVVNAVEDEFRFTGDPSDLRRVYAFSCNTAFAEYGLRLGADRLADVAEEFHIFRPDEAPEQNPDFTDLPSPASLLYVSEGFLESKAAVADTAFGQGQLLVTPLQMALVAAAIGNDGQMMHAYLVDHATDPNGTVVYRARPRVANRVMSPQVAAQMRDLMRAVVENGWESAKAAGVQGIVVGGKSGTAENVPGAAPHAWFIALAPLDKPRYAVCVMIENGGEGSSVGARLAGDVLRAAFALEGQ
ncbi:MAG: peptidoglycan glycosyltransferase [Herpetosiphonaceae bacterium]|nr:MAG: peptidoglycan glycosyltransferase [Herpetosiphonaceae bacterium]